MAASDDKPAPFLDAHDGNVTKGGNSLEKGLSHREDININRNLEAKYVYLLIEITLERLQNATC